MQHLDEGTIHAWLDGALPADEAAGVERHARECVECAALVADARGMIAGVARIVSALDDVPAGVVPKPRSASEHRSLWRTLRLTPLRAAIAASLMVFAASLAVIRHAPPQGTAASVQPAIDRNTSSVAAPQKTGNARETPSPAPAAAAPAPPPAAPAMGSATPKAAESPRLPVASDTAIRIRDVVVDSRIGDSISRSAAKSLAETARREEAKTSERAAPAPAAANGAAFAAGARPVDAQLRALAARQTPQPFRMMLTSADNRPLVLPGCYQLVHDTTSLARLPERFSLESEGDTSARRNIVRALTVDGRRDSVVTGVTWQVTPGFSASVVIARDGSVVPAFSRRQAVPSVMADVARGIGINGQLNRIECR